MELMVPPGPGPPRLVVGGDHVGADPDADLVAAARRDPAQFVALYDRYFPRVHGYVRLRVRDTATAEDVTSQVFTTALAAMSSYHAGGSFGAWLFRIAHNAVADTYRARRPDQPGDEALSDRPDAAPGPEEQALTAERRAHLRSLVATLRPEQQHLLALRFGAGLGFEEIGLAVGKTAVATRVSVHRILEDLRRRYAHDQ